jgi:hypothetical protein
MDVFLAKYDAAGNFLWARSAHGADNMDERVFSIAIDGSGNVKWAKRAGGENYDWALGIAVDPAGNVMMSGYFFSPTIPFGTTTLTNLNPMYSDFFLAKYDENGNILWAKSAGGDGFDDANAIAADASGNVCITGWFRDVCTFGSTTLTNAPGSFFGSDLFIARYGLPAGISEVENTPNLIISPNPSDGRFRILPGKNQEELKIERLEIYNLTGLKICHTVPVIQSNNEIDLSSLPKGIYFAEIHSRGKVCTEKLVIR